MWPYLANVVSYVCLGHGCCVLLASSSPCHPRTSAIGSHSGHGCHTWNSEKINFNRIIVDSMPITYYMYYVKFWVRIAKWCVWRFSLCALKGSTSILLRRGLSSVFAKSNDFEMNSSKLAKKNEVLMVHFNDLKWSNDFIWFILAKFIDPDQACPRQNLQYD